MCFFLLPLLLFFHLKQPPTPFSHISISLSLPKLCFPEVLFLPSTWTGVILGQEPQPGTHRNVKADDCTDVIKVSQNTSQLLGQNLQIPGRNSWHHFPFHPFWFAQNPRRFSFDWILIIPWFSPLSVISSALCWCRFGTSVTEQGAVPGIFSQDFSTKLLVLIPAGKFI